MLNQGFKIQERKCQELAKLRICAYVWAVSALSVQRDETQRPRTEHLAEMKYFQSQNAMHV